MARSRLPVSKNEEFAFKTRNCVLKTRNFVLNMMDFAGGNAEIRKMGAKDLGSMVQQQFTKADNFGAVFPISASVSPSGFCN